ncbi:hypothetical protein [Halarchaeum sp. P4]|uniref:hypothetical protein n=1 Tax=Halarchaeum sp. P4 TaxID=3421639 RepID=UPI003EBE8D27
MSDPLVVDLLEAGKRVKCQSFEEGEHGLKLLDEEGELKAYVPYDRLDYVHPKGAGKPPRRAQAQAPPQRSFPGHGEQGSQGGAGAQSSRTNRSTQSGSDAGSMPKNAIDEHEPTDGE